jgi:RNA polymerase sigma-70 factor (ECF subfamily)
VEFYNFDREYVQKLTDGDPAVEHHFVNYFAGLLMAKLRFLLSSSQEVEDLKQEVFLRVLRSLRQGTGVQHPERLGAFVNAVCHNVVVEHIRQRGRTTQWNDEAPEPADSRVNTEKDLVAEENQRRVRKLIEELSPKDRSILKAVFIEERDKDLVCTEFGVDRSYLRVLLHRAKLRFRKLMTKGAAASARQ